MTDITGVVEAVLALLGALLTAFVIPWIRKKTSEAQQSQIKAWVRVAVAAAEQIYQGPGRGEEKKDYVLNWLEEQGLHLDESRLDALIESAVFDLNQALMPL